MYTTVYLNFGIRRNFPLKDAKNSMAFMASNSKESHKIVSIWLSREKQGIEFGTRDDFMTRKIRPLAKMIPFVLDNNDTIENLGFKKRLSEITKGNREKAHGNCKLRSLEENNLNADMMYFLPIFP